MITSITVKELKERIDQGKKPFVLDVREPFERDICKLDDDKHISMREIQQRFQELDQKKEIVVYCRSGQRSHNVCLFLQKQGFENVCNLTGGILAWANEIDPTCPKY